MHPDTTRTMAWICKAGGQITPSLLAYWRFPWKHGEREGRRRLATYADRRWMVREGTTRYPIYLMNSNGEAQCANAGIISVPRCAFLPKLRRTAAHDGAIAAILARAQGLGVIGRWWSAWEISKPDPELAGKLPDAVAEIPLRGGGMVLAAIELEASKKGGALRGGRSNWAHTAETIVWRGNNPQELVIDGDEVDVGLTVAIALSPMLAEGFARKVAQSKAKMWWLVGDRLSMRIKSEPGAVGLDLLVPAPRPGASLSRDDIPVEDI